MARLVGRGLTEADARARIAAQASDEERRAIADHVVRNDGDRADLDEAVDRLWALLTGLADDARSRGLAAAGRLRLLLDPVSCEPGQGAR